MKKQCGSLVYASPQSFHGQLYDGRATDVWSAAVVLYVMVRATRHGRRAAPACMFRARGACNMDAQGLLQMQFSLWCACGPHPLTTFLSPSLNPYRSLWDVRSPANSHLGDQIHAPVIGPTHGMRCTNVMPPGSQNSTEYSVYHSTECFVWDWTDVLLLVT